MRLNFLKNMKYILPLFLMLCSGFLAAQNGTDCGEGSDCSETKKPFSDDYEYTFVKTNFFKSKYSDYDGKECEIFIRLYEKNTGVLKYKYRLKGDADPKIHSRLLGTTYINIWQNGKWVDCSNGSSITFRCFFVESPEKTTKCGNALKGNYYFLRSKCRTNTTICTAYYFINLKTYEECLLGIVSNQADIRGLFYKDYSCYD